MNIFENHFKEIENLVLKNAINWHLERRVIINENRTIVFN